MPVANQPRTKSIPARDVRVGMFLFLREENESYEVIGIKKTGVLLHCDYYGIQLEGGRFVLKGSTDPVYVIVMDHEF